MRSWLMVCAGLLACGQTASQPDSGTVGTATSTGTMNGAPFSAVDSTFNPSVPTTTVSLWSTLFSLEVPKVTGMMTTILVSDKVGTCATFDQQSDAVEFITGLFEVDASGNATPVSQPGTYAVLNPTFGQGQQPIVGKTAFVAAATCDPVKGYSGYIGESGTVTITAVSPTAISGTFSITFNDASTTTGSFGAASCPSTITSKLCNP